MAKSAPHSDTGAFRRVLFVDVPNTLDALWHWSELAINRLGHVELQAPSTRLKVNSALRKPTVPPRGTIV